MCRLLAFLSADSPMLLADVVLWPDRSIIKQSYDARERLKDPTLPFHLGEPATVCMLHVCMVFSLHAGHRANQHCCQT